MVWSKKKAKAYNARPDVKARAKKNRDRPENKAKIKARSKTSKVKARNIKRQQRPDVKAKAKEIRDRPENKAKAKELYSRPEARANAREYSKERYSRPEVKVRQKVYAKKRYSRPEVKAKAKELYSRPEVMARLKKIRDNIRLKILQYYSKHLSKSDIPCCNCCGENFHTNFLTLDHIAGRKEMDSEPELVKLGYSSKFSSLMLQKWIIKNNFPKGFQILCYNCNISKGHSKDNRCPLEGKPHF